MSTPNRDPQAAEPPKQDQARSGGDRTAAGSNYGDWRPAPAVAPASTPAPAPAHPDKGVTPSTAPSGIGSTPHK